MEALTKTVREYALGAPGAIRVFERFGIDYRCQGARPLDAACRAVAVSVDDVLRALDAPPVDGRANAECVRFLAEFFGVRRDDVEIIAGLASRTKLVRVRGGARSQLDAALAPLAR